MVGGGVPWLRRMAARATAAPTSALPRIGVARPAGREHGGRNTAEAGTPVARAEQAAPGPHWRVWNDVGCEMLRSQLWLTSFALV
jgi:hypothetical protein